MMRKKAILLLACLTVAAAITSFGIVRLTRDNVAVAQEKALGDGTLVEVLSIEEASRIAGYSVATADPAVAASMESATRRIEVLLLGLDPQAPIRKAVAQQWELSDGSWVRLVQAPGLKALGAPATVGGANGGRVFYAADEVMPARVSFYWQVGEMGFSLSGTLTGSISEELLKSFAESVNIE